MKAALFLFKQWVITRWVRDYPLGERLPVGFTSGVLAVTSPAPRGRFYNSVEGVAGGGLRAPGPCDNLRVKAALVVWENAV